MDQNMQNFPKYAPICKYARKGRNMQKYALRTGS